MYCCHACREVAALLEENPIPAPGAVGGPLASTTLSLGGLWCASCAWLVEERLRRAGGVVDARVSYLERKAQVTFEPTSTSVAALRRLVWRLGYRASEKDDYDEEDALFTRMLVGGLIAMHIMVISLTIYVREWFGLASPEAAWMEHIFYLMQFCLSIPLVFLLGVPILRAGINSLLRGMPNIQTLVGMGALAALALSARNLFIGEGHVYFDTGAMLFFLVTVGHWLELKAHASGKTAYDALGAFLPEAVHRIVPDREETVPLAEIKPGQRIRVRPGERIPVDGIVAAGEGEIDESLLSGEPKPVSRGLDDPVYAGSLNLDGVLEVIVSRTGPETRTGQIRRLLERLIWERSPAEKLADRFAARLVYAALLIAGLTFAGYWAAVDLETALLNSLSVLLIACPCALGIATPLTLWHGVGRALEHGVLVRSSALFEILGTVRRVYFDKTGTLTKLPNQVLRLVPAPAETEEFFSTAAAAEQFAPHPFARAIWEHAEHLGLAIPAAAGFRTLPGAGVSAQVDGQTVWVGSRRLMENRGVQFDAATRAIAQQEEEAGRVVVCAGWGGRVRGLVVIGEKLRPEARSVLADLAALGLEPVVLTGDSEAAGRRWARLLGIPVLAGLLPEDKLDVIRSGPGASMMVGDGINDGPALAAASVGAAMLHGTEVAQAAAEVTLLEDDLRALPWLVHLAAETRRRLRQNLVWAAVYNVVGVALAVAGVLQPVFAALAMVLSSAFVTRNALRLRRFPAWSIDSGEDDDRQSPSPMKGRVPETA